MTDRDFMNLAIEQAKIAADGLEVPVGAVIVRNGEVVSVGRNRREYGKNALAHAEIEAIDLACKSLAAGDSGNAKCMLPLSLARCVRAQ